MAYGVIEYNAEGKPKCEICGEHHDRVLSHVRQKHGMSAKDYKVKFGFDSRKGICSKESSEKTRRKTLENRELVIDKNLIQKGSKSRFKKGHEGRTKEKVSEQTRIALKERLKTPKMQEALKASGEKLGKSGLGNKARWNKNER
jgi:hypothetical protein